jgi:hypothetical protein
MAWLFGLSLKTLQKHSIRKATFGPYQIGRAQATTGVLNRTSGRHCPKCVANVLATNGAEGLFQRLEWSITCVHACFDHACPLIQLPRSENSHSAYDFASRVLQNRSLVIEASKANKKMKENHFEAYVRQRIHHGTSQDWLSGLDLTYLHRCCITLGASLSGFSTTPISRLPDEEVRALCELGFKHVIRGPSGLRAALKKAHHHDRSRRPSIGADIGSFYHWLHRAHKDPALASLVDTTRKHIFETYPASLEKEIFGQTPRTRQLYTMADVRIRTGLGTTFIKTLLGYLYGLTDDEALKRNDVTSDEFNSLVDFWRSIAKLKEAASLLGVLPDQVKKLQEIHVLKTIKITSTLRYVEREQIGTILHKVSKLPVAGPRTSSVSLLRFCRSNRLAIEKVVQFWLNDKDKRGFYRGDGHGLHQIMLDPEIEITREDTMLHGDLMVPEAARFLKINVHAIRKLRDAGYLPEVRRRNPDTNHLKGFITKTSIQDFKREFVTLGQAAKSLRIPANHLAQRLDEKGFETIDCKSGYVRVYSASDWARIKQLFQ